MYINAVVQVSTPIPHKTLLWKVWDVAKNKVVEFEATWFGVVAIGVEVWVKTGKTDHPGFSLQLHLLFVSLCLTYYDTRHADEII